MRHVVDSSKLLPYLSPTESLREVNSEQSIRMNTFRRGGPMLKYSHGPHEVGLLASCRIRYGI